MSARSDPADEHPLTERHHARYRVCSQEGQELPRIVDEHLMRVSPLPAI